MEQIISTDASKKVRSESDKNRLAFNQTMRTLARWSHFGQRVVLIADSALYIMKTEGLP
jgi:hypothetical protein